MTRMFMARRDETLGELLDRSGAALLLRRTSDGDVRVELIPDDLAADLTARELAEVFN